jgi:hypothetical protein
LAGFLVQYLRFNVEELWLAAGQNIYDETALCRMPATASNDVRKW